MDFLTGYIKANFRGIDLHPSMCCITVVHHRQNNVLRVDSNFVSVSLRHKRLAEGNIPLLKRGDTKNKMQHYIRKTNDNTTQAHQQITMHLLRQTQIEIIPL